MLHKQLKRLIQLSSPFQGYVYRGLIPKHILHIGAHQCEELGIYSSKGVAYTSWVEANPLNEKFIPASIGRDSILWAAVTDADGDVVTLKVTNNSVSSSIYELENSDTFTNIEIVNSIELETISLNSALLWANRRISFPVDFLVLDIQGAEGLALSGDTSLLKGVQAISIEVSHRKIYTQAHDYEFVQGLLRDLGFRRTMQFINSINGHGDELWINRGLGIKNFVFFYFLNSLRNFLFKLMSSRAYFFWSRTNKFNPPEESN